MTYPGPRILLVDDDASLGQVLQAGLETEGFSVRYETRPTEALRVCLDYRPDLVLLDVDMPVMDGGQVAAELRSHPVLRHTPVIFISSLVTEEEAGRRNASHEILLSKQIRMPELVAKIRAVLQPKDRR